MKQAMKFILLLLVCMFLLPYTSFTQSDNISNQTYLRGVVTDIQGRVTNAKISIINSSKTYELYSDKDGKYAIILEPGIYQLKANLDGYSPFERANFKADPCKANILDIPLTLLNKKPFQYDCFKFTNQLVQFTSQLDPDFNNDLYVEIQYEYKEESKTHIKYYSQHNIIITYNFINISAKSITFDKIHSKLYLLGNIYFEENKFRFSSDAIQFNIINMIKCER